MYRLIHQLLHVFRLIIIDTQRTKLHRRNQIYLIANNPVFHSSLKALYKHFSVIYEEINHLSVTKAAIFGNQMQWYIIMRHRDYRLHTILYDFINQIIIKFQSCLIWLSLIPVWKNA